MVRFVQFLALFGVAFGAAVRPFAFNKHAIWPGSRIIGGEPAGVGEFKSIVQVKIGTNGFCGGSILESRYVLTAAHCTSGVKPSSLKVIAGSNNFFQGKEYSVNKVTVHPGYNSSTVINDISILRVSRNITFGDNVQRAVLAQTRPADGANATTAGWGVKDDGNISPILLKTNLNIVSKTNCQNAYLSETISDGEICAAYPGRDSCQGDSGGPLYDANNQLAGIVSWGYGCANPLYPGVYTDVPYFHGWILQTTNN